MTARPPANIRDLVRHHERLAIAAGLRAANWRASAASNLNPRRADHFRAIAAGEEAEAAFHQAAVRTLLSLTPAKAAS